MTEFGYVYDFGDNWEHRVIVEQPVKPRPAQSIPGSLVVNVEPVPEIWTVR